MPLRPFCSQKGAVGVKQPYIRVVGLEQSRDNNSNGPSNFTLDEVVSFFKVYIDKGDTFICKADFFLLSCRKWNSKNLHRDQMHMPSFAQ
jgi:hypothetical protein